MPPHCDSMDGPVVTAARRALDENDVDVILAYVHKDAEAELRDAFDLAVKARAGGGEAAEVADLWFFETAVRLHRAGEMAPYTGLKPAGLDVGPAIPAAEQALHTGSPDDLADLLCGEVREQVVLRLGRAVTLALHADDGVAEARAYVEASLGLQVWAHQLHKAATSSGHAHG